MRKDQSARTLGRIERQAHAHKGQVERARQLLMDRMGVGYPAGSDGGRRPSGTPTLDRFLNANGSLPTDHAAEDLAALDEAIERARHAMAVVDRIVPPVLATHFPTTNPDSAGGLGCEECGKARRGRGPHPEAFQPRYIAERCSWHCDFVDRYGVLPASAIVEWHLDHLGSRVPLAMVREHHPDEFQAHHASSAAARA